MNIVYGVFSPNRNLKKNKSFAPINPVTDYPVSRDWVELDCNAVLCINNRDKKCIVPSLAKIDENGTCGGFKRKE